MRSMAGRSIMYFNTSHVTVYHLAVRYRLIVRTFQYISCYGLSRYKVLRFTGCWISIHLMLRFIRVIRSTVFPDLIISIHLMLRFIGFWFERWLLHKVISIHLMLRFIPAPVALFFYNNNFNTSHVTVYQLTKNLHTSYCKYFNTSHVTVYLIDECQIMFNSRFQYISCYGLSAPFAFVGKGKTNFNTSHVTVYRNTRKGWKGLCKFQYISCYGLSIADK